MEPITRCVRGALVAALALAGPAAAQTSLRLEVRAAQGGGPPGSVAHVQPGATLDYAVTGELVGAPTQGLCMFAFDARFDGGPLAPMAAPATMELQEFVAPRGFNNPAGFGGTPAAGELLQVGGAMNTIANQFAPTPSGVVLTGIAAAAPEVLAVGTLTAPATPGTYTLALSAGFANALEAQNPGGSWRVRPLDVPDPAPLTVVVVDCAVRPYCAGKVNSAGCVATVQGSGVASLGGAGSLVLTASDVVNRQFGVFVFGRDEAQTPLYGGTLCVASPVVRLLEPGTSGGTGAPGTNCTGAFTRVIDAGFLATQGLMLGETVHCQWLYRDPLAPDLTTAGLSGAARFTVCP